MKKVLSLFAILLVSLCMGIPALAADEAPTLDGIIKYDGLSARSSQDYAGLRSTYTVDNAKIDELEAQGYQVLFGALMGVGQRPDAGGNLVDWLSATDMTVSVAENNFQTTTTISGKKYASVLVYASEGSAYTGSNMYNTVSAASSTYSFTTTFGYTDRDAEHFRDTAMVYRGYILLMKDGAQVGETTYIDAKETDTFGNANSAYGTSTSLYEVCKYLTADADEAITNEWKSNFALLSVIEDCQNHSYTETFDTPLTVTKTLTDNPTVTLSDMSAGVYKLDVDVTVASAQSSFTAVIGNAYFNVRKTNLTAGNTETFTMYVTLPSGNSNLQFLVRNVINQYSNVTVSKLSLEKAYDLDNTSTVFYDFRDMMIGEGYKNYPDYYVKDKLDSTVYYHRTEAGNSYTYTHDIATSYTEADLSYSCLINAGTGSSEANNAIGFGFHCKNDGISLQKDGDAVRFTITAPKDGMYTVYLPYGSNRDTTTHTLKNITPALQGQDLALSLSPSFAKISTASCSQNVGTTADGVVEMGEIYLQEGENNLSFTVTDRINFTQITFSPAPSYDTVTFKNANDETISVQKAYTAEDLKAPLAKYAACKGKEYVDFDLSLYTPGNDVTITGEEYSLHTVTFKNNDTVVAEFKDLKDTDDGVLLPSIPAAPGNTKTMLSFGWKDADGNSVDEFTKFTGDMTVTSDMIAEADITTEYTYTTADMKLYGTVGDGVGLLEITAGDGSTTQDTYILPSCYTKPSGGSAPIDENAYLEITVNVDVPGFYRLDLMRHKAVSKTSGRINYIKAVNQTLVDAEHPYAAYPMVRGTDGGTNYTTLPLDGDNSYNTNKTNGIYQVAADASYTTYSSLYLQKGENVLHLTADQGYLGVAGARLTYDKADTVNDTVIGVADRDKTQDTGVATDAYTLMANGARMDKTSGSITFTNLSLVTGTYSLAALGNNFAGTGSQVLDVTISSTTSDDTYALKLYMLPESVYVSTRFSDSLDYTTDTSYQSVFLPAGTYNMTLATTNSSQRIHVSMLMLHCEEFEKVSVWTDGNFVDVNGITPIAYKQDGSHYTDENYKGLISTDRRYENAEDFDLPAANGEKTTTIQQKTVTYTDNEDGVAVFDYTTMYDPIGIRLHVPVTDHYVLRVLYSSDSTGYLANGHYPVFSLWLDGTLTNESGTLHGGTLTGATALIENYIAEGAAPSSSPNEPSGNLIAHLDLPIAEYTKGDHTLWIQNRGGYNYCLAGIQLIKIDEKNAANYFSATLNNAAYAENALTVTYTSGVPSFDEFSYNVTLNAYNLDGVKKGTVTEPVVGTKTGATITLSNLAEADYAYCELVFTAENGQQLGDPVKYYATLNSLFPAYESEALNGKTALFMGDSITYGSVDQNQEWYTPSFQRGWAGRIAVAAGMSVTNNGVSGRTLSTVRVVVNAQDRIIDQYKKTDYDFVILHGGINDATSKAPVGEITPDGTTEFNIDTYAGALEELFYTVTTGSPNAKIGYIINYQVPGYNDGATEVTFATYIAIAKAICEKWNIPYLNLHDDADFTDLLNPSAKGGKLYDYLHLSSRGYDFIYEYVMKWMETLPTYDLNATITPENLETFPTEMIPISAE